MIDFSQTACLAEGVIAFPPEVMQGQPPPRQVKETVLLRGRDDTSRAVTGSPDDAD